ncbi:MAG: hypothetical protein JSU68_08350 [Phycisphaerales bacterium]|nr:MAG: hypothetical protein JSU68_08350 [Phycisphaerales bacterium]
MARTLGSLAVACLFWCPPPVGAAVGGEPEPPIPNAADPVDYIAWMNAQLGAAIENNTWELYRQISREIQPFPGDLGEALDGPWSENLAVRGWLAAQARPLAKFREAADGQAAFQLQEPRPTGDARLDRLMVALPMPGLMSFTIATQALLADGYYRWEKGEPERLTDNALVVLRAAHHLESCPWVLGRLLAASIAAQAYQALRNALSLSDDPDALAAKVLAGLEAADPPWSPITRTYLFEQVTAWDFCQRVFVPGKGSSDWSLHGPVVDALAAAKGSATWDREQREEIARIGFEKTLEEVDEYFDAVDRWCAKPWPWASRHVVDLNKRAVDSDNPLCRTLLPLLQRPRVVALRAIADRRATHLIFHIFAQRGRNGSFPWTLDQVEIVDLGEMRIDPFADELFLYRRTGDEFLLFSRADNARIDRVRHDPHWQTGDFVFWPVQQETTNSAEERRTGSPASGP